MLKGLAKAIDFKAKGKDAKYFSGRRKGELSQLKEQLRNPKASKQKDAVKRVIASMTIGKDVSSLFTEVAMCMECEDLELKKLVYLYLINYAKTKPELLIMLINSFKKDCSDFNPLIRGLAIRTMGCIKVPEIVSYIVEPLGQCLRDEDAYVRKTAALTALKLHEISESAFHENGFLEKLIEMVNDSNPNVVANALTSLQHVSTNIGLKMNEKLVMKLLAALSESTEWSQVSILSYLHSVNGSLRQYSDIIVEKVLPRLQHVNPSVVLSCIKLLLTLQSSNAEPKVLDKVKASFLTLISTTTTQNNFELLYVILKDINLIMDKYPALFASNVKSFFCTHSDPSFVKVIKLELLLKLTNSKNYEKVVDELKDYSTDFIVSDKQHALSSIRTIGKLARKSSQRPDCLDKCFSVMKDLINSGSQQVIEQCIVVVATELSGKFRTRTEEILQVIISAELDIKKTETRVVLVHLVGEFENIVPNAFKWVVGKFIKNEQQFLGFDRSLQLMFQHVLTKLVVQNAQFTPTALQTNENANFDELLDGIQNGGTYKQCLNFVSCLLHLLDKHSEDPDVRSKASFHLSCLAMDSKEVRSLFKQLLSDQIASNFSGRLAGHQLDEMISNLGNLSALNPTAAAFDSEVEDVEIEMSLESPSRSEIKETAQPGFFDLDQLAQHAEDAVNLKEYLLTEKNSGFGLAAKLQFEGNRPVLSVRVENLSHTDFTELMFQIKKNCLGLKPVQKAFKFSDPLKVNQSKDFDLALEVDSDFQFCEQDLSRISLQVAVKNSDLGNVDKFSMKLNFSTDVVLTDKNIENDDFIDLWSIESQPELCFLYDNDVDIAQKLKSVNFHVVGEAFEEDKKEKTLYFAAVLVNGDNVLGECVESAVNHTTTITLKGSSSTQFLRLVKTLLLE